MGLILFRLFGFLASKDFKIIINILALSVPDEGYSNILTLSIPNEGYSNILTLSVPNEGYSNILT
jgi:hypothetical protein